MSSKRPAGKGEDPVPWAGEGTPLSERVALGTAGQKGLQSLRMEPATGSCGELVIRVFYSPPDRKEQLDCEMIGQIKKP